MTGVSIFHTSFWSQGIDSFISLKLTPHSLPICAFHPDIITHRLGARNSLLLIQILLLVSSTFTSMFSTSTLRASNSPFQFWMPKKSSLSSLSYSVLPFHGIPIATDYCLDPRSNPLTIQYSSSYFGISHSIPGKIELNVQSSQNLGNEQVLIWFWEHLSLQINLKHSNTKISLLFFTLRCLQPRNLGFIFRHFFNVSNNVLVLSTLW